MTTLQQAFIGTPGNDITAASSGGTSGSAFTDVTATGGTAKYASDSFPRGGTAGEFVGTTTNGVVYAYWTVAATDTVRFSLYMVLTANPSAETVMLFFGAGATRQFSLVLADTGALRLRNGASAATTMSSTVPLNTLVRVDGYVTRNATTGAANIALFTSPESTTPTNTITLSGSNTGSAQVTQVRVGIKATTATTTGTVRFKNLRYDDATTQAYMGPLPATPPVVAVSGADAYLLDASGSTTSTTPAYSIAQTDGPTFTPVALSPGLWRVTRTTTARVYDVTVTDSVGSATQSVTVPAAATASAGARIVRRRMIGGVLQ